MDNQARVNVLLKTFPGLSLPPTVSFSIPSAATTTDLLDHLTTILPPSLSSRLTLKTTCNRILLPSQTPISTFLSPTTQDAPLLPLHLSFPTRGGKGGFGSQLRAAGGRMSSRKRKNALASDPNNGVGSNRNLDGRRLRTITEAKNLAEYLATKPEMDKREKEERRKRWEGIVEVAERREGEMRKGGAGGRGKGLSDEWLEEKEDAGERTREAVRRAMAASGGWTDSVAGRASGDAAPGSGSASGASGGSRDASEEDSDPDDTMDLDETEVQTLEKEAADGDVDAIWVLRNRVKKPKTAKVEERRYLGFDEDDEFMSSEEEDGDKEEGEEEAVSTEKAKGKQKMAA
jgi:Silencing defective 2 N-terminal ubiquitin domain